MRILTTHAGSLPRPKALVALHVARSRGEAIDEAAFDAAGEAATLDIVRRQREAGVDIPSDGEQLREAFFLYVRRRMSGFGSGWIRPAQRELADYPEFAAARAAALKGREAVGLFQPPMAVGPVRHIAPEENLAEIAGFRAALDAAGPDAFADAFITAPSPGIVASAMKNAFYASDADYLEALGEALRVEYEAAIAHGFMLQIDAPDLALERHVGYADRPLGEFVAFVRQVVAVINRALRNVPRDRVRLHACWGNYESPHDRDVALKEILPAILEADVGAIMLPFGNPRHQHEIRVFRDLPLHPDQTLIAGVIDTCSAFVEHPEVVAERLERAAEAVGDPARIQAGTDCGFDTSAGMGRLTGDIVWAKLRTLRDGAEIASRRVG
ncbi:cobalamin-independent methionine synthase II family protein [Oceanibacterium hippocampi]|uniref:Methionine synthase n=1 Tax=Oceanibacterium hippocampi TaxID=745714 RepID=A0A1Y5S1B5_9PROT|nr:cobalamin-independent methionine synthase II family protein [Oceanibacterium hippocampi]SLN30371.1 methionine synthase [Oceanibacterium hippocampi]